MFSFNSYFKLFLNFTIAITLLIPTLSVAAPKIQEEMACKAALINTESEKTKLHNLFDDVQKTAVDFNDSVETTIYFRYLKSLIEISTADRDLLKENFKTDQLHIIFRKHTLQMPVPELNETALVLIEKIKQNSQEKVHSAFSSFFRSFLREKPSPLILETKSTAEAIEQVVRSDKLNYGHFLKLVQAYEVSQSVYRSGHKEGTSANFLIQSNLTRNLHTSEFASLLMFPLPTTKILSFDDFLKAAPFTIYYLGIVFEQIFFDGSGTYVSESNFYNHDIAHMLSQFYGFHDDNYADSTFFGLINLNQSIPNFIVYWQSFLQALKRQIILYSAILSRIQSLTENGQITEAKALRTMAFFLKHEQGKNLLIDRVSTELQNQEDIYDVNELYERLFKKNDLNVDAQFTTEELENSQKIIQALFGARTELLNLIQANN